MEGLAIQKLANALDGVGFTIKRIEEESYSRYERPPSGEKYTGEIIIRIRPLKDEKADAARIREWEIGKKAEILRSQREREDAVSRTQEPAPELTLEDVPL
jgi:hypothetical protein